MEPTFVTEDDLEDARKCARSLAYAEDDLDVALSTWKRWWLKDPPSSLEIQAFIEEWESL